MPGIPFGAQGQTGVADARWQIRIPEIVGTGVAQWFAGVQKDIQYELALPLPDVSPKIADGAGGHAHFLPVSCDGTRHQPAIGVDNDCRIAARRSEVEQNQPARGNVVTIVGEIWIGLDQVEFEDLPEE
ncbi:MAG: hypothetical protein AW09_002506 [Candidatus Accumulibacter phosphatis]|uniref:Uncharacterized protein n=1 Tax=Candidatus Accumulibacter phosphatis TaxID=327160 RepID=A0A080LUS6_9PROT|nr:MAG: hypothetical protein AW09_002506 [Candidatus Accumulibacter phosphatis]